jgi:glucosamine 6-phosphate synthetase-like amidotransferase/phosphosugar isomerase protein
VGHDSYDDFLGEMDLYESPDPMVLIKKKKINKANKELAHLLNILNQTLEVEERIREVMTRLKTYKVITIISSGFIFMS